MLFAMLPGASRSAYLEIAVMLLSLLPGTVTIHGAHARENNIAPPQQTLNSLIALRDRLTETEAGQLDYAGFFPRALKIDETAEFLTSPPWNNK